MRRTERMIARKLISTILAAGHLVSLFDGEEDTAPTAKLGEIMADLGAVDFEYIRVWPKSGGGALGWVFLVHGNDFDIISDYTTNLESLVAPANALADRLAAEA